MEVSGASAVNSTLPVNRPPAAEPVKPTPQVAPATPQDEVEISAAGRTLGELSQSSEIRQERLAQIKAAIDDGTYESQEKFEIAMSRLLDRIDRGDV